ncbi:glutathione S-transferase family protein [Rhodobacteraceae bacterium D3-12]|nr:glutathione S-transferase family protein [Rhodobacteraceae bacterium D3-12]
MLTLYHAPMSRSSRIVQLLHELSALDAVEVKPVSVLRNDGSGGRDADNPHPEGKVPLLVHDGVEIWESNAIMLYLTELFPEAGLGVAPGEALRGRFLSWLAWYGNIVEPVLVHSFAEISHPAITTAFRGLEEMGARLAGALEADDWLVGETFSAADLLMASPFVWMPSLLPDHPGVKAWAERCQARPSAQFAAEFDAKLLG